MCCSDFGSNTTSLKKQKLSIYMIGQAGKSLPVCKVQRITAGSEGNSRKSGKQLSLYIRGPQGCAKAAPAVLTRQPHSSAVEKNDFAASWLLVPSKWMMTSMPGSSQVVST